MKHLLLIFFFLPSLILASLHPIPHYDFDPLLPCACRPYYQLREEPINEFTLAKLAEYTALNFYSFGFGNYDVSFKQASHFFTPTGWESIQAALESSSIIDTVIENKFLVSSEIIEPAFKVRSPNSNEWIYQLKLKVTFDNAEKRLHQILSIRLLLRQFEPGDKIAHVGVERFLAQVN